MERVLKTIFANVFYPAAAGNVFWSFCQLAIDPSASPLGSAPRLFVLFVFAVYLTLGWLLVYESTGRMSGLSWLLEYAHLVTLTIAALVAEIDPGQLENWLIGYFAVTIIGHILGAWENLGDVGDEQKSESWKRLQKLLLVAVNAFGLAFLWFGGSFVSDQVRIFGSFGFALALWLLVRATDFLRILRCPANQATRVGG